MHSNHFIIVVIVQRVVDVYSSEQNKVEKISLLIFSHLTPAVSYCWLSHRAVSKLVIGIYFSYIFLLSRKRCKLFAVKRQTAINMWNNKLAIIAVLLLFLWHIDTGWLGRGHFVCEFWWCPMMLLVG